MKKEILKLTGLTEDQFYKKYPTEAAFEAVYPNFKLGGLTEAFPQIATADNFFSYGVPVPPTYYMSGGPVYPQIQTEAQFFSPVYSNSNNAYAVGGSYMEAYPQAKVYPQGPVGGSAFYAMQDGGSPMQEPAKDQTFYTQKMNDFFDKLRQNSYKNMMGAIMNTEDQYSDGMKQLSVGQYGGRQPLNFYIPNNQTSWRNIREQKNLGLGDLTKEQLDAIKTGAANVADVSYETRRAILPKNRIKSVNVKFTGQGAKEDFKGTPYLMPGQKAFDPTVPGQAATTTTAAPAQNQQMAPAPGTQGMSPYGPYLNEYLFGPDNAPATVNAQVAAQQAAAQTAAASPTPSWLLESKVEINDDGKALYVTEEEAKAKGYTKDSSGNWKSPGVSTPPSSSVNPDADYIKNSKYPDLDQPFAGTNMTQRERLLQQLNSSDAKEVEYAKYRIGAMNDWDAMQGSTTTTSQAPSNTQSMDPNVAAKKAAMQTPSVNQPYVDSKKPKYTIGKVIPSTTANGSLQSWADIEKAIGPTPKVITGSYFEKINDYCSQFPGAQGCYSEPYSKLPNQENIAPNERRNYFDAEKFKQMPYVQQVLMAIESPSFRRGVNDEIIDPYEVIGAPFRLAADYDRGITEYYKTSMDGKRTSSQSAFTDVDPAYRFRYSDDADNFYSQFITPEMARELGSPVYMPPMMSPGARFNFTQNKNSRYDPAIKQKYGGPYVLPMYQGMVGPSQTGFQAPWQKTLDITNPDNYKLDAEGKSQYVDPSAPAEPANEEEFEVGVDVSRVKNFDDNFSGKVQMAADVIGGVGQNKANKMNMRMMMKPENWANSMDQFRGDYAMNQPAGADFRPDQMVSAAQYGGVMMYDMADLFFLTPQMLKKTQSRR